MEWYKIFALVSFFIFIVSFLYHLVRLIRLGKPTDYSRKAGSTAQAIRYSFTSAMSPAKKESAFLHLPTYTAGIVFHLGTFLSIFLFFVIIFGGEIILPLTYFAAASLVVSGFCGVGIFIKRLITPTLRSLSNADDYISNLVVTLFHLTSAYILVFNSNQMVYYVSASLLLLYFPLGKLKHTIYFFAARYHLGVFYGWRGVWPLK